MDVSLLDVPSATAVAAAASTTETELEALLDWFYDQPTVVGALVENPASSAKVKDVCSRLVLALDENWVQQNDSGAMLRKDPDPKVRCALASNPLTGDWVRQALTSDEDVNVRLAVAIYGSPAVLVILAKDPDPLVRAAAASSSRIPAPVLDQLGADTDSLVRLEVARATNVSGYVLAGMVADESTLVRAAVASNLATPRAGLERLGRDADADVRAAAARTMEALDSGVRLPRHTGPSEI